VTALTADSKVGIQYTGTTAFIGLDLGLQLSDGTVFRTGTPGGSAVPWGSGVSIATDKSFGASFFASTPPALLSSVIVSANGILAGSGGRKAAVKIRIQGPTFDAETVAAAFSAPDTAPDSSGCAVAVTGDGSAAVPAPGGWDLRRLRGYFYRGYPFLRGRDLHNLQVYRGDPDRWIRSHCAPAVDSARYADVRARWKCGCRHRAGERNRSLSGE